MATQDSARSRLGALLTPERLRIAMAFAAALGLVLKLNLALTTYGSNDVRYWQSFQNYIAAKGSITIYRDISYYNHPPFMSLLLMLVRPLAAIAPNGFPFVWRLPAILSDVVSGWLVYRLVARFWNPTRAALSAIVVWLSPVLVLVSGFHGNTDPVFVMLILLAADRILLANRVLLGGLLLGLATNVKLVPILVMPTFFFWLPTWRDRAKLAGAYGALLIAGYAYHVIHAYDDMMRNVFGYASQPAIFGITWFFRAAGIPEVNLWLAPLLKNLTLAACFAIGLWMNRPAARDGASEQARGRTLLRGIGATFLVFFVLTPGFGVQYAAWFVAAALFLDTAGAAAYSLLAGYFLFRVYHFWNNERFPWYLADSDVVGPWGGFETVLGMSVWLFFFAWSVLLAGGLLRRRRAAVDL